VDLSSFRLKHNLHQEQLSLISGYSLDCIRSYECGRRKISGKFIVFCELYEKNEILKSNFNNELNKIKREFESKEQKLKSIIFENFISFEGQLNIYEHSQMK